ncbi:MULTISPECIES: hypothetical protein [Capnocytophaga]|uniref:Tetratricopeptide repeat protein n=1 Tax=Capnocytophaga canis TaxID=1848903 RepID=A0A3A1YGS6_9FLAO|nr:hypothetical protein [Capnocytophaga canis]RIY35237.1 hypothetical protein CKY20_11040 [Capnocytophaga canis]
MTSNPINQRIEAIAQQWDMAKFNTNARLIRICSQDDEQDMVDTFFTYMIAVDSTITDVSFHFDSIYSDDENFTKSLLKELDEVITIWNTSNKEGSFDFEPVHWKPNYTLGKQYGWAGVFTANFNLLAEELNLCEENYTVAILKNINKDEAFLGWLSNCLQSGIDEKVRFLVTDTVDVPFYEKTFREYKTLTHTIILNLNMPLAMEQVAAMIPPNEPSASYRKAFTKLLNAVQAQKEDKAIHFGNICIKEAEKLLGKDPYWTTQLVVVYSILANDQLRYKNKKEGLKYADSAIMVAVASETYLENTVSKSLIGQTTMFRATMYYMDKKWEKAYEDYTKAYESYQVTKNIVLIIESARMLANSGFHCGRDNEAMEILAKTILLGKTLNSELAYGSSFSLVVSRFIDKPYEKYLKDNELDAICTPLFGKQWRRVVLQRKKIPDTAPILKIEES